MGFMIVTAFLSMWISNTATTAMMLPISQAVLEQLSATEADSDEKELREGQDNQAFELAEVNIKQALDVTGDKPKSKPDMLTLLKLILLFYNVTLYQRWALELVTRTQVAFL